MHSIHIERNESNLRPSGQKAEENSKLRQSHRFREKIRTHQASKIGVTLIVLSVCSVTAAALPGFFRFSAVAHPYLQFGLHSASKTGVAFIFISVCSPIVAAPIFVIFNDEWREFFSEFSIVGPEFSGGQKYGS
jgi:hypothetical protein